MTFGAVAPADDCLHTKLPACSFLAPDTLVNVKALGY